MVVAVVDMLVPEGDRFDHALYRDGKYVGICTTKLPYASCKCGKYDLLWGNK